MKASALFLPAIALLLCCGLASAVVEQHEIVAEVTGDQLTNWAALRSVGISWERHNTTATDWVGYGSNAQLEALSDLGVRFYLAPDRKDDIMMKMAQQRTSDDADTDGYWAEYHDYTAMTNMLISFNLTYPDITSLYSIGQSVQGRELWVLKISDNVNEREPEEPQFKYIGNMHGDEVVGRELLLRFIYTLLSGYEQGDPETAALVSSVEIHILPSMNPDGFELQRRANANGVDINRNFPDQFLGATELPEPEVWAVMQWSLANHFVMSANLHGGNLVCNYPYDGNSQHLSGVYSASPDDALFRHICLAYSSVNYSMRNSPFPDGITNGAMWYILYGGMQDWNYVYSGSDFEVTVELGSNKWPSAYQLADLWSWNRDSLTDYLKKVNQGVRGTVTRADGQPVTDAVISIDSAQHDVTVESTGWYFRPLAPGSYVVSATSNDEVKFRSIVVSVGTLVIIDFVF